MSPGFRVCMWGWGGGVCTCVNFGGIITTVTVTCVSCWKIRKYIGHTTNHSKSLGLLIYSASSTTHTLFDQRKLYRLIPIVTCKQCTYLKKRGTKSRQFSLEFFNFFQLRGHTPLKHPLSLIYFTLQKIYHMIIWTYKSIAHLFYKIYALNSLNFSSPIDLRKEDVCKS